MACDFVVEDKFFKELVIKNNLFANTINNIHHHSTATFKHPRQTDKYGLAPSKSAQ